MDYVANLEAALRVRFSTDSFSDLARPKRQPALSNNDDAVAESVRVDRARNEMDALAEANDLVPVEPGDVEKVGLFSAFKGLVHFFSASRGGNRGGFCGAYKPRDPRQPAGIITALSNDDSRRIALVGPCNQAFD